MDTNTHPHTHTPETARDNQKLPQVFDYLDYRKYLSDYYSYKKANSRGFSYGSFAQRAQLTTKNYLKRIIDGERPLSADFLPRFSDALGFTSKEALYFENLVNFNQAKDQKAKQYYFANLIEAAGGSSPIVELASHQFEIFSDWFYMPLFEYCELATASQETKDVSRAFKGKLTSPQIKRGFEILEKIGLIKKNPTTGRFEKTISSVRYDKDVLSLAVQGYHRKNLENTISMIGTEPIENRYLRSLSLAISKDEIPALKKMIEEFTETANNKFTESKAEKQTVIQLNFQFLKLTE